MTNRALANQGERSVADPGVGGLSSAVAAQRLKDQGPNELSMHAPRGFVRILLDVFTEPMFLLLLIAAAIYIAIGEFRESMALVASLVVVLSITVLQERRTEHALARLRDLASPRALVIRDGIEQRIAGRDVVVGDLILLHEGDRVPADGVLCKATGMFVDESLLTGESLSVEKAAQQSTEQQSTEQAASNPAEDSADEAYRVYSGSLVVQGFGAATVTAVGEHTEIGKIGGALNSLTSQMTPLNREIRRIARWVAGVAILLCVAIAVIYAITRHDWLGGVLAGITVAMGLLPEEFPVVLTVFLAMGAWRISRVGVLTRRMPAIESIGAATVLAVDKTGTLTENKMQVAVLDALEEVDDLRRVTATSQNLKLQATTAAILETAFAASEQDAFDPMEQAIHSTVARWHALDQLPTAQLSLVKEYDLTATLPAVTHVWRSGSHGHGLVAVKGAPETVFDLCRIGSSERKNLNERVAKHAQSGLRVLAVARGQYEGESFPDTPHGFELRLLGLLCFADPLRAEVPTSLQECYNAGIRVVMITGDHSGTALAIAEQAGFDTSAGFLTGSDIEALDEVELSKRVRDINIYARAKPQHKLRLVKALQSNGEIVAMTGDGVNDAPALKAANIGVAMGARGTDVAREAAALVLVNDDFASLVRAVRLGRRIYANIRHAMSFIVAVHIPIAGLGLFPVLFGWPLLFFPMHVLFLEFIIDPACALVFEADEESADTMRRKPRRPDAPLFSRAMLWRSTVLGFAVLAFVCAVYATGLQTMDEDRARALAFVGLVVANIALIFVSRSRHEKMATLYARPNVMFWWIAGAAGCTVMATVYVPVIAAVFNFSAPPVAPLLFVIVIAVSVVLLCRRLLLQQNPRY